MGQPVVALHSGGGFATQARVAARYCLPWPTAISAAQAVALAGQYLRAYLAVAMLAQVESGQRVLVHDGTSPFGIALIQCAIARGATVISTVEDESGVDFVVRLGVDHPINRRKQDWAEAVRAVTQGRGAACIFDLLGGDTAKRSLRCIAQGGSLLLMGFASQVVPTLSGALLVASGARIQAFCHPMGISSETLQSAWEQLLRWYRHHPQSVLVAPERRLADAPSVLVQLAERRPYGARVMRA